MSYLFRRPLIYLTIGSIIVVISLALMFYGNYSRSETKNLAFSSANPPNLIPQTISLNQNATLSITVENYGSEVKKIDICITTTTHQLSFYYPINGSSLPKPDCNGVNCTFFYSSRHMSPGEVWTVHLTVKGGLEPEDHDYRYVFYVEAYVDNFIADRKNMQLTVTR